MDFNTHRGLDGLYLRKIRDRITEIGERFLYSGQVPVAGVTMAQTAEHLSFAEAKALQYRPVKDGTVWGRDWASAWFRIRLTIPKAFRGQSVALLFDLDKAESLIFRDGQPVQGLCWSRKDYVITEKARGGETVELYVEAGANARLGAFVPRIYQQPALAVLNREVWKAYWDLSALYDIIDPNVYRDWTGKPYHTPDSGDTRVARITRRLSEAVDLFDYRNPSPEDLSAQARRVSKLLAPVYASPACPSAQTFAAMGHAHIDVAWKWPLSETVRKSGRTFANVLNLMDVYPRWIFAQSQPYLYECAKQRYPGLYRKLKARVKEGRWAPTGGMYVEPDCQLTSGESLVRQLVYGMRFFEEEFGVSPETLWLPDVFGFNGALPQILRRAGIRYFFTTKMALNQFSEFPHHSFHWEGIDGSRVLAHCMPAEEYSCQVEPWLIRTGERVYAQRDRSSIQILPYGHGDGGGGPAKAHLERLERYADLEGMPHVESMGPDAFFHRLEQESEDFPRWVGELYLEMHRGCFTSQGQVKRNNRKAEFLLRETEALCAFNALGGSAYPSKVLDRGWKTLLLNQFHDILPGSSIPQVYEDSSRQFEALFHEVGGVLDKAMAELARRVDTSGAGIPVVVFNSMGWRRKDVVAVPDSARLDGASYTAVDSEGVRVPVQRGADGMLRFLAEVPAMGYAAYHLVPGATGAEEVRATAKRLENAFLRVELDAKGRLRRVFDKAAQRDVLDAGALGNQFFLFEDKMASTGSSWDFDIFFNDKVLEKDGLLTRIEVIEQGPVRAVIRMERQISQSILTQDLVLYAHSPRLDFETVVDWGAEKDVLLKTAFPLRVRAASARYEIPFGNIERPTHWNRPSDMAQFEVPAHKWADLSEHGYGTAVLNDGKYGYDAKDNVLRLSLLRAPDDPDPTCDIHQRHVFTYALFPHAGSFSQGVVREGYALNQPLSACVAGKRRGALPSAGGCVAVEGADVILDTVKQADDGQGVILRLYEAHGGHASVRLLFADAPERIVETDLREREEGEVPFAEKACALDFLPYQVRTFKVQWRQ